MFVFTGGMFRLASLAVGTGTGAGAGAGAGTEVAGVAGAVVVGAMVAGAGAVPVALKLSVGQLLRGVTLITSTTCIQYKAPLDCLFH